MAFCGNCGNEIKPGARFCKNCGAPVPSASSQTQQTRETPPPAPPIQEQSGFNHASEPAGIAPTPVHKTLKAFGGSVLMLFYILILIASIIVSIITYIDQPSSVLLVLLGRIPTILSIIGLLFFFADCRANIIPRGKGISIYKAGKITTVVVWIILGALISIALFFGGNYIFGELSHMIKYYSGSSYYGIGDYGDAAMAAAIFAIVIIAIVLIIAIIMQLKLIQTANVVRTSLQSGRPTGKIPVFPAVIMIIFAVFCVIGLFSLIAFISLFNSLGYYYSLRINPITSIILMALPTAQMITGAILILRLRRKMAEVQ